MKAVVIDMDIIKTALPGYKPSNAKKYHEESSQLAKNALKYVLTFCSYNTVTLMGGGSASGKTEYVSSEKCDKTCIVFDGTLANVKSLERKLAQIKKSNKTAEVCMVIPGNLTDTFNTFLMRDRKVPAEVFYQTHTGCRKTLLWLTQNHPEIKIEIIINLSDSSVMEKKNFASIQERDKFIQDLQISDEDIRNLTI